VAHFAAPPAGLTLSHSPVSIAGKKTVDAMRSAAEEGETTMPRRTILLLAFFLAVAALPAVADPVADFYAGKQVSIYVGSEAGSGFDAYARLVARHLAKHIPGNPVVVVLNQPGAGSVNMTNSLANIGPKDGTAIGAPQSSAAMERLLHLVSPGGKAANFDAASLNWIGNAAQDVFVLFSWSQGKVKSFADLTQQEMISGSAGPNTDGSLIANALNKVFGTKIKLITGYTSSSGELLAMERGEVDGAALAYNSAVSLRPDWVDQHKIRFLLQMGLAREPKLGDVPFALDLVKNDEDRQVLALIFAKYVIGRPYFVAQGVPAERVEALRIAFDQTVRDPGLLADAQTQRLEISPMTGKDVQDLLIKLYHAPDAIVQQARAALGTE
jgi:tripartite-type tricarboxylate transporter receptor subunit TctC